MPNETLEQWAVGFLDYLAQFGGERATGPNDPRVKFLMAMAEHEGTFSSTNPNNPLDIVMNEGVAGSSRLSGNSAGVQTFKTREEGYKALHLFLVNQGISGLLGQLMSASSTVETLGQALAAADWEGSGTPQAKQNSQAYAATITQAAGGTLPNETGNANLGGAAPGLQPRAGGQAPPDFETEGMNQAYTGPNAYKGFDLSGIPAPERGQAERAIDAYTRNPKLARQILNDIFSEFPQDSWMATIPEVRTLLLVATYNHWPVNQFQGALESTNWWKQTSDNLRLWEQTQATDPGQAKQAIAEAQARVTNIANSLGVELTAGQLQQIATTVASQSVTAEGVYSNTQFTDQQIYQMVTSTIGQPAGAPVAGAYTPPGAPTLGSPQSIQAAQAALAAAHQALNNANQGLEEATAAYRQNKNPQTEAMVKQAQRQVAAANERVKATEASVAQAQASQSSPPGAGSPSTPAPGATPGSGGMVTGTSGGDAEALYNAFTTIARNYYLNLTPQQIQAYVNSALSGDTGQANFQSGAIAGFTTTAENMAKQMYPGLAAAIGTTDTTGLDNTPYAATAWIRNMIAQYTGLGSGDNVNLMDPQWSWILSGKAPPASQSVPGLLTANPNGNAPGTGNGMIPSADDLQRYLMSTPQFQKTDAAKTMGWQVGSSILKAFGFNG